MGRLHHLEAHSQALQTFFNELPLRSFTKYKLHEILEPQLPELKLPGDKGTKYVIDFLLKKGWLSSRMFRSAIDNHEREIYSWKTDEDFTVVSGLKHGAYYAYYSALFLHGLTLQIPKVYYLNSERSTGETYGSELSQDNIDKAFAHDQRKSGLSYTYQNKKVMITNGKYTDRLGVIGQYNEQQCFAFTDLERTLIDIAVRPVYSGGVFEVLEAYQLAREKADPKKIANYLRQLNYQYPYHQLIGFYMEKAGYPQEAQQLFDQEKPFRFYLTYHIRNKVFSERWKLYYPLGF